MVTGEQDGQVGHAELAASPATTGAGTAGELETPGAGATGTGTLGELVEPACPGTGTTGVDDEGVAMTGAKKVEEAPASMGLGLELGLVTIGTGTTVGLLLTGQFLTVGAQLVRMTSTVLRAVASTTGVGADGAETCSWT